MLFGYTCTSIYFARANQPEDGIIARLSNARALYRTTKRKSELREFFKEYSRNILTVQIEKIMCQRKKGK